MYWAVVGSLSCGGGFWVLRWCTKLVISPVHALGYWCREKRGVDVHVEDHSTGLVSGYGLRTGCGATWLSNWIIYFYFMFTVGLFCYYEIEYKKHGGVNCAHII